MELTREEIVEFLDENQKKLHTHFPVGHLLSSKRNCENCMMLTTYYRRNLHRFAEEYLGLHLYWYQKICLFFMGIIKLTVIVAARASAKSYIIAVYSVSVAILYPHSSVGLTSGTRGQSSLIITKKIIGELMNQSPRLRAEIEETKTSQQDTRVIFKNHSEIVAITLGMRGNRTTVNVAEEAREINKKLFDETMSPSAYVRPTPYLTTPYYSKEESPDVYNMVADDSTEIYISSSVEDTHWLYKMAKDSMAAYLRGENACFFAMDYAISLQCGIRKIEQLKREKKKLDPVTWLIEYENAVLRANSKAYFDYDVIRSAQVIKKAFYPRLPDDVINRKPNPYNIPKQKDEVRIIAADIAMIDKKGNDNSCFSCLRLLPDKEIYGGVEQRTFSVQVPYLEAIRGTEMRKQAIRIRQLFTDFGADYIVIDVRNGGFTIIDTLCKTLYDDERCLEYPPIKCMNDEALNRACTSSAALPVMYAVSASTKLNSNIAVNLKSMLGEGRVQLLVPKDEGIDEIRKYVSEYIKTDDPDIQLFYENPYLQTMLLFSEMINLEYTKTDLGDIRIHERPSLTKDRYTSISYGCWFATELARDLLREEEIKIEDVTPCVSVINF